MPHNKTMRITGGILVRRRFLLPAMVDEGSVRPTPDRVREAVFSMLAPYINNAKVLDLFAGSGAHGFEALSRGASYVHFIEKNPRVACTIKENLSALKLTEQSSVQIGDVLNLTNMPDNNIFDIIFVDPPYTIKLTRDFFINLSHFLSDDGVVIFRCFKKESPDILGIFHIIRDRVYGGTRVFVIGKKYDLNS